MPNRSKHKDAAIVQTDMFGADHSHAADASQARRQISGSIGVEPLGKGIRVTGCDAEGGVLWGFVATRAMLQQPHGAIAIYDRLREILNENLAALALPTDRPADIIAAAEAELEELNRLVVSLRKKINVAKGMKPTEGQLDKARDIYRAAHDVFLWISQETAMGRTSQDDSDGSADDGDLGT